MLDRAELLSLNAEEMIINYRQVILKPILSEISWLPTPSRENSEMNWTSDRMNAILSQSSPSRFSSIFEFCQKNDSILYFIQYCLPKIQLKLLFNSK